MGRVERDHRRRAVHPGHPVSRDRTPRGVGAARARGGLHRAGGRDGHASTPPLTRARAAPSRRPRAILRPMINALSAFDHTANRLFAGVRRATAGRLPALSRLETPRWVGIVVAGALWGLIVAYSEPWGRLWGTGQDARCYWQATLAAPYLHSDWNDPIP